jgi:hypothetical protein
MPFRGAWPDTDACGGLRHGSAGRDKGGEDVNLTSSSSPRHGTAKGPVPHASRLAAASHSSRPSIGML